MEQVKFSDALIMFYLVILTQKLLLLPFHAFLRLTYLLTLLSHLLIAHEHPYTHDTPLPFPVYQTVPLNIHEAYLNH